MCLYHAQFDGYRPVFQGVFADPQNQLIRARMAESPEQSDHTSIKQRIEQALKAQQPYLPDQQPRTLFPFAGNPRKDMPDGIPINLADYLLISGCLC